MVCKGVKCKMTKEMNWPALLAVGLIAVLIGGTIGAYAFPRDVFVEKEVLVVKEVPVEIEVIKEIPAPSMLDKALPEFLKAVENEEDEAGNELDLLEGYDFDEISVSKVYDEYSVVFDKEKTIVEFKVKLKYDDKTDDDRAEKIDYSVVVTFEDEEDTVVEVD